MAVKNGPSDEDGRTAFNVSSTKGDIKSPPASNRTKLLSSLYRFTICVLFVIQGLVPSLSALGVAAESSYDASQEESCRNEEAAAVKDASTSLYPCTENFLKDFWHDEPSQGFHIGCLSNTDGSEQRTLTLYKKGLAKLEWISDPGTQNIENWTQMKKTLRTILYLRNPDSGYNFQPYAIFSPEGRRLADGSMDDIDPDGNSVLDRLLNNGVFLIYEGGQFLWPGVRAGFERSNVSLYSVMPMGMEEEPVNRTVTITTLSMRPLVVSIKGFLSDEECTHVQRKAEPNIRYSGVVLMDKDKGRPASDFRTSQSAYFNGDGDPIIQDINNRVASLTRIPRNHQEHVQVLRYGLTEKYDHHTDYFDPSLYKHDPQTLELIGHGRRNRLATVFWYLSDVPHGGETVFPMAFGNRPKSNIDCSGGLLVKPERGKVIIFYSLLMSGKADHFSLHGACPVKEGVKWAANKWVWNEPMFYTE